VNILQGEFNCIWAHILKGFSVKISENSQKLELDLHSSVTKLLQTNELDYFIDSDMGSKIRCFQAAIFSIDVDSIRDQNAVLAIQLLN